MPLLRISALHKYYGDHHVLKGIDLTVEEGQVVAIIGRSGSGKSTLLRTLNGLESINDGVIEVDGEYLDAARADLRSLRQKVGMVFQQFNLFPHLTVGENVMLAPQVVQKVPKAKAAKLARQMLERVGLGEKFDAFPDRLSGGQQQRVAIARALAMSPKVLLCDEITSALDPELVNEVLSVVRQLAKDGMTLIMVTHEMRFAREVGDKLVFMHQGKVHEVGDPKVLFANPRPRARQFHRLNGTAGLTSSKRPSPPGSSHCAPARRPRAGRCRYRPGPSAAFPASRPPEPAPVATGRWRSRREGGPSSNRWHAHPPGRA
jgi:polar amino acid transport system ATP-binding protein